MADTSSYTLAQLSVLKASNDHYISNRAMYKELNKIKLLVLRNNNLYGNNAYTVYHYTSEKDKDFFSLLLEKLSIMFPDCYIYYTKDLKLNTFTFLETSSILSSSKDVSYNSNGYTSSPESITNTIFILQTNLS